MTIPREFETLLMAVDVIREATTREYGNGPREHTSVYEVLGLLTPILESPWQHVFPSIRRYANLCNEILVEISRMLHAFDSIRQKTEWFVRGRDIQFGWRSSIKEHTNPGDYGYKGVGIVLTFNTSTSQLPYKNECIYVGTHHRAADGGNAVDDDLFQDTFDLPMETLKRGLMVYMDCRCPYIFTMNSKDITVDMRGDPKWKYTQNMKMMLHCIESRTILPCFDVVAMEREANFFKRTCVLH